LDRRIVEVLVLAI